MRRRSADVLGYSGIDGDRQGKIEFCETHIYRCRNSELDNAIGNRRKRTRNRTGRATGLGGMIARRLRCFISRSHSRVMVRMVLMPAARHVMSVGMMGVFRAVLVRRHL